MTRVAVLDDHQRRAVGYADWDSLGDGVDVSFFHEPIPRERLAEQLAGYEVLVLMRERTRFDEQVLAQLPRLQLVVTTGMRNASLDVDHLVGRGVVVSGTAGISSPSPGGVPSTAEVAWALILAVLKRVTIEDRAIRAGRWQTDLPANLGGTTLGLAGLGHLGASMIGPARAFGMNVIAWSQSPHGRPRGRGGRGGRVQGRAARALGCALDPPGAVGAHARSVRSPRAVADAPDGGPDQYESRADRRSAGAGRRSRGRHDCRRRPGRLRHRAAARRPRPHHARQRGAAASPRIRLRGCDAQHVRAGRRGHRRVARRRADPHPAASAR